MYRNIGILLLSVYFLYWQINYASAQLPKDVNRNERYNFVERNKIRIDDDTQFRLPNNTIPVLYDIALTTMIHVNDFYFSGIVTISILVVESTNQIVLHSRQQEITSVILSANLIVSVTNYTVDDINNFLTITLSNTIAQGTQGTITIHYNSQLRTDHAGFYRTSYVNDNNEVIYLATTQFQSTDARHAFPCYDEPALKANFSIQITHGQNYSAISNMPGTLTLIENGLSITTFSITPLMSTYLIAFVVSNFNYMSNINETVTDVLPHRTFARSNAIEETELSLQIGEEMLIKLEEYFNVSYPLPKMDQIAIPQFPWGGMENWGLITYREEYFLWNANSDYITKSFIHILIAHEMAHNWFGNLISPKWWTYLWINEGFATLYEYYAIDMINPNMNMMDFFVVDAVQFTFISDALESTRPMTQNAEHPDDIEDLFDSVAYFKSGCVLRMIQYAITENTFRKGLTYFLNEHKFNSVDEFDLYESLQEAINEDGTLPPSFNISEIMRSWSSQSGFPVLHINRNYIDGSINITQERYLSNVSAPNDFSQWWIPYNFVTKQSHDFTDRSAQDWLPQGLRTRIIYPSTTTTWNSTDWIVFNRQQTGYYRVMYDYLNYDLIIDELNNGELDSIHPLSRSQLIDDAFNFARTNRLSYDIVFDMIKYLHHEHEFIPWASAINGLTYINRLLDGSPHYHLFQDFFKSILLHFYETVGVDDMGDAESHLLKYARSLVINWMCRMGHNECLEITNSRLLATIGGATIHPNLRSAVFCSGLRHTSNTKFLNLLVVLQNTTDENQRLQIVNSLGCTLNENALNSLINSAVNMSDSFTMNERIQLINSIYRNSQIGLNIILQHLPHALNQYHLVFGSNLNGIFLGISSYIVNEQLQDRFDDIVAMATITNFITEQTHSLILETLEENSNWIALHQDTIVNWLQENDNGGANNISSTFNLVIMLILTLFALIML